MSTDKQQYIDRFYSEILFSPDPRRGIDLILDEEGIEKYKEANYWRISIQLGKNGEFEIDNSHSALLERRDDGFYELLLPDLDKGHLDVFAVFRETYNIETVCNLVEKMFYDGKIKAHLIDYNEKPVIIDARKM